MRAEADFATGIAPAVAGLRSFRDTDRRDIEAELGWPPGPGFTLRGKTERGGVRALDIALLGIPRLLNMVANAGAASGTLFNEPAGAGQPQEPENEVDDFPVLWAAPGSTARTLPWQLDPARRPKKYRTELVLTDQRLLILGVDASAGPVSTGELWATPHDSIADIERMRYSEGGADVRVRFTDGSWTRWKVQEAPKLVGRFHRDRQPVAEDDLTSQQRERLTGLVESPPLQVSRAVGKVLPITEAPSLERFSDGTVMVELRVPISNGTIQTVTRYLSPTGTDDTSKDRLS
ncbi:hypothetical protein [Streptomyces shenzhenensis]|uniref:hypothetical protein n=1 Tax=Streptomyces shenzhenensis TaxID=943815 RepID=UPI001F2896ED|nr:hypothetical protein [Streptomyces shenzhenensis]